MKKKPAVRRRRLRSITPRALQRLIEVLDDVAYLRLERESLRAERKELREQRNRPVWKAEAEAKLVDGMLDGITEANSAAEAISKIVYGGRIPLTRLRGLLEAEMARLSDK